MADYFHWLYQKFVAAILAVPMRIKIGGIVILPVLILGFTLNYWIQSGLSDWLSYLLSDNRVRIAMQAGGRSVLTVTILAAICSLLFTLLLTYLLTRPVLDLKEVAQAISSGKLDSRATIWAKDEIGEVASSINTMIDRLVASQAELEQANQRLAAMNQVAMAAGRELDLQGVLAGILPGILEIAGLEKGWVYLVDGESERFSLALPFHLEPDLARVLTDDSSRFHCTCQAEILSGSLGTQAALRSHCPRLESLGADYCHCAHIAIPLQARGQILGVINLLCDQDYHPLQENLEVLSTIGAQASEIIANAWLHERLVEKEAARRALLESLVQTEEEERLRLARELHDGAGQTLTGLLIRLKTLEKQSADTPLKVELVSLQDQVSSSIEQVREISYSLRPAMLEEFGLALALENLLEDMAEKVGLSVQSRLDLNVKLPTQIEMALYRIAQESLTNIIRHAAADQIAVELSSIPYGVYLRIEDNGAGFEPDQVLQKKGPHHLGLISMQERAEMLGGTLTVASAPGAGTCVEARIPVSAQEEELE
jgi:signal transduction histidine kinase